MGVLYSDIDEPGTDGPLRVGDGAPSPAAIRPVIGDRTIPSVGVCDVVA